MGRASDGSSVRIQTLAFLSFKVNSFSVARDYFSRATVSRSIWEGEMRVLIAALLAVVTLGGCASNVMEGFVGQPLQIGMARYGPPDFVFDMPDGRRAFQWSMTRTGVTPTYTSSQANVYAPPGSYSRVTANSVTTGGQVVSNTCRYTMYAELQGDAWIFTGFEPPSFGCQ